MPTHRLGRDEVRTLVLHVLAGGPRHGYAIARDVEVGSEQALRLGEGTLYPVLRALEQEGLVTAEWEPTGTGPARKVYAITPAGRAECRERVREWRTHLRALGAVLGQEGLRHA
jgi:PadR family transcriptional regulator PadR